MVPPGDPLGCTDLSDEDLVHVHEWSGRPSACMNGEAMPGASTEYWGTGGGRNGFTEVMNERINRDPMMRVFQRCDVLEAGSGYVNSA